ncbi:MAG: DNA methyltransferase [Caldisphaera sp.]
MVNGDSIITYNFFDEYEKLDKDFNTYEDNSYKHLVNFSQIEDKPIHRWFHYQEGYSPQLVINILNHLKIEGKNVFVFDPFAGSGTTLLVAKQMGIKSLGFEINPFSTFMAKVKTRNYDPKEIKQIISFKPHIKEIPDVYNKYKLKIIKNIFNKEKLEKIESLKQEISKIKDEKVKEVLFAALLFILEDVSNYRKGGNGLKKKRINSNLDPLEEFIKKINQMGEDLEKSKFGPEPTILNDSCLNLSKHSEIKDIDISIFSPPYANCFDPFEVYKIELWIGEFVSSYEELKEMRKTALTSNLNADLKKNIDKTHRTELLDKIIEYLSGRDLWDKRIPQMLDRYFYDMYVVINNIYKKTKKGGYCIIVIGNSAYGNLAIPTDIILAQLGKKVGFKVKEIIVARKNETSSQQLLKLGNFTKYLRESIVVLEK